MISRTFFTTFFCIFLCCSISSCQKIEDEEWNLEQAIEQARKFNSPDNWDLKMLQMEMTTYDDYFYDDYPLMMSPFPTPEYSSPGNGNRGLRVKINGKQIIGHTALIGRGTYSEDLFLNADDKYVSYFTILVIDDQKGNPNPVAVSSRNHPNYFAQGSINTGGRNRVDWVAIQMADGNAYAVVNGKIFDLRVGRVIFAAPKKDGSIRFYQANDQTMNPEELDQYLKKIEDSNRVVDFFSGDGNI